MICWYPLGFAAADKTTVTVTGSDGGISCFRMPFRSTGICFIYQYGRRFELYAQILVRHT